MADTPTSDLQLGDPSSLVAIARAARLAGDRHLERAARRLLREQHGIDLTFLRSRDNKIKEATSAAS